MIQSMNDGATYYDAEFQITEAFASGALEFLPAGEEFPGTEEFPLMQTADLGSNDNTEASHASNVKSLMKYIVAAGTAMGVSLGGFFG